MTKKELLRGLPKIDEVMKQESLVVLSEEKGDVLVTDAVRAVIAALRASILNLKDSEAEKFDASLLDTTAVAKAAEARIFQEEELNLYPLINATGTILHTNLGRAPLCRDAVENVEKVSKGYSDLEYNVPKGKRGSRHDLVGDLIADLTGAEDAMVVNNNAAATMIVLATLGKGKEIVVSRGELVEIGGAFRIPDIMMQSGAFLQEVGTSNKTKASDYENAIMTRAMLEKGDWYDADPRHGKRFETGALMKVHKSNYDIVGFTEEATLEELVEIGKKHDLPVIFDMGNGLMLDMSEFGLDEPNIPASLATGIDVMLFRIHQGNEEASACKSHEGRQDDLRCSRSDAHEIQRPQDGTERHSGASHDLRIKPGDEKESGETCRCNQKGESIRFTGARTC